MLLTIYSITLMLLIAYVNGVIIHPEDGSHQGTSEHLEATSITLKTS